MRRTKEQKLESLVWAARNLRKAVDERIAKTKEIQRLAAEARKTGQGNIARTNEILSGTQVMSVDGAIFQVVQAIEDYDGRQSNDSGRTK